jgi:hypothetical protein
MVASCDGVAPISIAPKTEPGETPITWHRRNGVRRWPTFAISLGTCGECPAG